MKWVSHIAIAAAIAAPIEPGAVPVAAASWRSVRSSADRIVDVLPERMPPELRSDDGADTAFTSTPALRLRDVRAQWPGRIALEPAGAGGFGYDPIFLPHDASVSAAELPAERKDAISHRRQAFDALMPVVREHLIGA